MESLVAAVTRNGWQRTSEPVCYPERSKGKWRLRLMFTSRKGDRATKKYGPLCNTEQEALCGSLAFRYSWEGSQRGQPCEVSKENLVPPVAAGKDGYWGYDQFEEQVEDVMDVLEHIDPDMQIVFEVDHSSGHGKQREDGLHVSNMNVKYGGKQKVLRDSVMTEECLGPEEAKMYFANGRWSTKFSEGAVCVDQKLTVGQTQTSTFAVGAPPPFFEWDAPRKDKKNAKGKVKEGYEGKAKGVRQYLWERGWWKDGMSTGAGVSDDMHVEKVLQALPDFKNERTALQHLVESRGHILLSSPKCHPEVAGVGIEYSWGFSKQKFRRKINDEVPKHLHDNIENRCA
ncbi:unnamed protein product [Ectocarpus sp. CCAP 1310/34]|nr:unnamed protein product [Ectocarpus sp. CCAP 1310/34]